ncbi:MAG: TIM-barrel domain-containing protein, partial [Bryobacteraceae bacterium]
HLARILVPVYNAGARASLVFGFTSFDRASTDHEIWWEGEPRGVSSCDFAGHKLAPDASIDSETLWIDAGSDPHRSLERWAGQAQARYRPKIWPSTPAGWVGWSWVDSFNVERYEDVVLRNAKAVRRRLPGLDIEYVWVSLGNLEDRRPGAWLHWNRRNFPSGPEALTGELESLKFRLGLWAGAFWLNQQLTADVERLRETFLKHNGKPIAVPSGQWGESYVLDPTHPKTHDWLREVFSTYRKWGVRYYMIDFLNAISGPLPGQHPNDGYSNRSLIDWPEAYRNGMRVIREAAGDDTYLLTSTGPTFHNAGLVDAIRAGSDYGEGRPLDGPGKGFYPGTFVINRPEYWTSHRQATDALASNYFVHRKLFLSDSGNVLTIDKPVPRPDAEISATIFGINGGPIMLGDDIDRMSGERLEIVKKLFPRLRECARPVDLFDSAEPDYPKVFDLKVRRGFDEWHVVALFNYGRDVLRQILDFSRLGLAADAGYVVWDFWNERYLGVHRRSLDLQAPPQSVRLLRISRERTHPWLLSTDMHLRQGQAEIAACDWNAERRSLSIRASRPRGYRGNVYVRAPKGLALENPQGLWIAKDPNDDSLIIRVALEFPEGASERTLTFVGGSVVNR